jgi:hypothetical protein
VIWLVTLDVFVEPLNVFVGLRCFRADAVEVRLRLLCSPIELLLRQTAGVQMLREFLNLLVVLFLRSQVRGDDASRRSGSVSTLFLDASGTL